MNIDNEYKDSTIENNYLKRLRFLIREYELIKSKKHSQLKMPGDFYKLHRLKKQNFLKYYHRYKLNPADESLKPQKRGPRYKTRRIPEFIEKEVSELRKYGWNRYEISNILKIKHGTSGPSPSGVYKVFKRNGVSRLDIKMKVEKRKIIKKQAGELGHIDCHTLPARLVKQEKRKLYLVSLIDDYTRLAWGEVVEDITSLTVMFSALRTLNVFSDYYGIKFKCIMSDNGAEFGQRNWKNKNKHAFMRMLMELGIDQIFIKPYRPQTNGKIERFWRTLNDDFISGSQFKTLDKFKEEFIEYLAYYNHQRPHQGINGMIPNAKLKTLKSA